MSNPSPWWRPRQSSLQGTMSFDRLGTVERLSVQLFNDIKDLVENDAWDDLLEEANMATTTIDPTDCTDEAYDKFYDEVEALKDRIVMRTCRALMNSAENRYDKIADLAQRRASEQGAQT